MYVLIGTKLPVLSMAARDEERRTEILPIQRANVAVPPGNGAVPWMTVMLGREHPEHMSVFALRTASML